MGVRKEAFFTVSTVEQWHRLPREVVESLSSEAFRTQRDTVLSDLLWVTLPEQLSLLDDRDLEVLLSLSDPVHL